MFTSASDGVASQAKWAAESHFVSDGMRVSLRWNQKLNVSLEPWFEPVEGTFPLTRTDAHWQQHMHNGL